MRILKTLTNKLVFMFTCKTMSEIYVFRYSIECIVCNYREMFKICYVANVNYVLPMIGANRHELPISGNSFGPGTSEYGFTFSVLNIDSSFLSGGFDGFTDPTSFGNILIADENVVLLTREFAADLTPILLMSVLYRYLFNKFSICKQKIDNLISRFK